jgi:hypothetical protein
MVGKKYLYVMYYITYQYFSTTQLLVVCASQLTAREG